MLWILVISVLVSLIIGVPVAFSLGIGGAITLLINGDLAELMTIGSKVFRGMESFPLMAIPFFILAGELMGLSITTRLVNFASALVGHIRGGLSQITVITSFFFGGVTGVGVAETAAVGSIMIPAMKKKGYKKSFAAALVSASATLGPIVPPSVPLVIYALAVGGSVSITSLFLAGVIPAILIAVFFMILCYVIARRDNHPKEAEFRLKNVWVTFKKALAALFMPLVIIGGLVGGFFTPTEAAVVAVFYAIFIGFVVHKDLKVKDLPTYIINSSVTTGVVLVIIGFSKVISYIITINQVPVLLSNFLESVTSSPLVFMLITAAFLFLVGMFIEGSAAIIMLAPVLAPIALAYGLDPTYFGFAMVMNLMLGMITPPVGVILFVACGIANITLEEIVKQILPFLATTYFVLLLVILFPELALWVPRMLGF